MEKIESFVFTGAPSIVFGQGSLHKVPEIIKSYGPNVLVVIGEKSFTESGNSDVLKEGFKQLKIHSDYFQIKGEPSPLDIDYASREYRKKTIHSVLAIGGGSVLDSGKAIAAMLACDGSVKDYLEGIGTKKVTGDKAPFVAVPTTAGTGSEATKNAVLREIGKNGYKRSLRHDAFMPDIAVVDPELAVTCPKTISLQCGLDAISQLMEAYTSSKSSVITDALAQSGLQYAAFSFPRLLDGEFENIEVRTGMAYASLMSGLVLSHAGLGTVHGIAGPIGGKSNLPHSLACGLLIAPVFEKLLQKAVISNNDLFLSKMAIIGKIFAGEKGKTESWYADQVPAIIHDWVKKCELPSLSEYSFDSDSKLRILEEVDNKNSGEKLSIEEISEIIHAL